MKSISISLFESNDRDFINKICNYLKWLLDNYEKMDDEAKAYADRVYDNLSVIVKTQVKKMPDSI